jgi:hypothetical protein
VANNRTHTFKVITMLLPNLSHYLPSRIKVPNNISFKLLPCRLEPPFQATATP